jgi:hypothetical protein
MLIAGTIGGAALLGGGEPLIILPPELAATFERGGYDKQKVKAAIFERATLPLESLSRAVREHLQMRVAHEASDASDGLLRLANQADDIMIVVAGGVGVKAAYIPTWGGGTRAVSRAVRGG